MGETKSYPFTINVEPTLAKAVLVHIGNKPNLRISSYIRKLIIDDLRKTGELPDEMLVEMLT